MHIKSSQSDQMASFCLALPVTSEELAVLPGQVSLSAGHPSQPADSDRRWPGEPDLHNQRRLTPASDKVVEDGPRPAAGLFTAPLGGSASSCEKTRWNLESIETFRQFGLMLV